MTRAQRLAGEHCGRRTTGTSSYNLGWARARRVTLWSCWAPSVQRLQGSRGVTELLIPDELQNWCVQKTGCLKVILERTMTSVPNWSEMRHSGRANLGEPRQSPVVGPY